MSTADYKPDTARDWERDFRIIKADYEGVRDAYASYKADEKARWEKQTKELRHQKQEALHEADRLRSVVTSLENQQQRDQRIIEALTKAVESLSRDISMIR